MARLIIAAIAGATAFGLSSAGMQAAEPEAPRAPGEQAAPRNTCSAVGMDDRTRCLALGKAAGKERESNRECEEVMHRQQRRCMLDVLDKSRPVAAGARALDSQGSTSGSTQPR
jgi:hypothetical protein